MSTMAMADGRSAHAARGSLGALALGALDVVNFDQIALQRSDFFRHDTRNSRIASWLLEDH
jgi:hypothetical protein